jgi:hypothetical protein
MSIAATAVYVENLNTLQGRGGSRSLNRRGVRRGPWKPSAPQSSTSPPKQVPPWWRSRHGARLRRCPRCGGAVQHVKAPDRPAAGHRWSSCDCGVSLDRDHGRGATYRRSRSRQPAQRPQRPSRQRRHPQSRRRTRMSATAHTQVSHPDGRIQAGTGPTRGPDPRHSRPVLQPRTPHACCPRDGRFPPQPCPPPRLLSVRRDGHPRQPTRVARCRTRFPPPARNTRTGSAALSSAGASTATCTPHWSVTDVAVPAERPHC